MQQWNKPLLKNHKITPPSPELPSPLSTSDEVKNRLKTTECIKIIDDHPDNKDPPLIKTRSYKFLLTDNQQQNKGKGKDFIKISTDKRFFILLSHWSSLQDVNQIAQVPHYDGENREPCENHGLSRNCNHHKSSANHVHCQHKTGRTAKTVKVRIPASANWQCFRGIKPESALIRPTPVRVNIPLRILYFVKAKFKPCSTGPIDD